MDTRKWTRVLFALAAILSSLIGMFAAQPAYAVPSFGRQTGLACEACHTAFPELTPFGRRFKLNGYVLDNLPQVQTITPENKESLLLNWIPPLSVMFQASYTKTKTALPDSSGAGLAQNGQVLFPEQMSLFYAGRIAPNLGAFIQATYSSDSGNIALDNTDIRYANHLSIASKDTIIGVTANNNPTVQDVWNSTAAWQVPFSQQSSAAPTPTWQPLLFNAGLAQQVAGLSAYVWWNDSVYAEVGAYRSAPQGTGTVGPLDSVQADVIDGVAPYWRLAYEHGWGRNALSVGTYGLAIRLFPGAGQPLSGPTNRFTDTALDAQYQYLGDDHIFSVQTTWVHERQSLDASFNAATPLSANATNTLNGLRIGGSYYYQRRYGAGLGYFAVTGSADSILYSPASVTGSATGSPDSRGWTAELDYLPWQNVKFALQYTAYSKFNGASNNYDTGAPGRNASDNNTLYLLAWFNF